jgi:hypothetical protein
MDWNVALLSKPVTNLDFGADIMSPLLLMHEVQRVNCCMSVAVIECKSLEV